MRENIEKGQPMRKEQIIEEVRSRRAAAYSGPNKLEKFDRLAEFGQYLQSKYPNPTQYALFHILTGSTLMREAPFFDFPGEDSIEKFIKEKL